MDGDKAFVVDVEEGNQGGCVGGVEDLEDGRGAVVTFVNVDAAGGEPWVSLLQFIWVSNRRLLLEGYSVVLLRLGIKGTNPSGDHHDVKTLVGEKLFTGVSSHTPNCR